MHEQVPVFKPPVQERRQKCKELEGLMVRPVILRMLGDQPGVVGMER